MVNGNVNLNEMENLIEFQIKNGINGLVVCGTTGESATLSDGEKKLLIKFVVDKVKKRVPVMAGTGTNDTYHSVELSKYAESVGVDSLLLVTPYYNKTNQNGLIQHFLTIAQSVSIPCVLYNVPSRTSVDLLPRTVLELAKCPNIVGIKEASNNFTHILEILEKRPTDFSVLSGNDDSIIPLLSLGGNGVISVLSNIFPKDVSKMCEKYFNGSIETAKKLQLKYADIIFNIFSDVNPIPIKEAMNILGFNVGNVRLPLIPLDEEKKENLKIALEKIETVV